MLRRKLPQISQQITPYKPERVQRAVLINEYCCNACGRCFAVSGEAKVCPYCGSTDLVKVGEYRSFERYERRQLTPEEAREAALKIKRRIEEHFRKMKELFDELFEDMFEDMWEV